MKRVVKQIPNTITISRILMTITFVSLIFTVFDGYNDKFNILMIIFIAICISDLLDGRVARKLGCTSIIGAKLDIFADLFFIVTSYIALIIHGILPMWFLVFIMVKFLEFIATSNYIKNYNYSLNKPFVFDRIGRIVSAMFFIISGISCALMHAMPLYAIQIINIILLILLVAGGYSSFLRVRNCIVISNTISKKTLNNI